MKLLFRKPSLQLIAGAGLVILVAAFTFMYGARFLIFDEQSPTEASSPLPETMANVIEPTEDLTPEEVQSGEPWAAPDFAGQAQAAGWSESAFRVPLEMRKRVNFWKQVYSKVSTDQGLLHDPVTLDVYETVQFDPLKSGESLTLNARHRQKIVDAKKALIAERLLILQERLDGSRAKAITTPFDSSETASPFASNAGDAGLDLSDDDLRYWRLFESSNDPQKFARAAARIRFQLGQRNRFYTGIYFSGRYLRAMEQIFREEGLPIELTRLPFVESSFNTRARSKVGASGIWQFMRRTAKPYLKINQAIDERNEPLAATRAAARLMKGNFGLLGNWPLAITAWNHGPSGVRGITQKLGTDDLAKIVSTYSSRTFGFASQNFYACFLAALEIESDAKSYFKRPVWQTPLASIEIKTPSRVTAWPQVIRLFNGDESLAEDYNPQLNAYARNSHPRIPAGTKLWIPANTVARVDDAFRTQKTAMKSTGKTTGKSTGKTVAKSDVLPSPSPAPAPSPEPSVPTSGAPSADTLETSPAAD